MNTIEQRIGELETLAAEDGFQLPWPAVVIARLEECGVYVDLRSGLIGDAGERVRLTPAGRASLIASQE